MGGRIPFARKGCRFWRNSRRRSDWRNKSGIRSQGLDGCLMVIVIQNFSIVLRLEDKEGISLIVLILGGKE